MFAFSPLLSTYLPWFLLAFFILSVKLKSKKFPLFYFVVQVAFYWSPFFLLQTLIRFIVLHFMEIHTALLRRAVDLHSV